ncbi:OmpA family protein [Candidatus Proelusimicrobium volucris]|uniref:OmpA family protein n=1 Tax=Candidatus Proelusimicrobium volucris TaxID=3416225 RepID=UPI003D0B582B
MRFLFIVPVLAILLGGCYSAERKNKEVKRDSDLFTLSALCPERANEEKWRNQTVDEMRASRKIPSVDFEFDGIVLVPSSYEVLDKVAAIMVADRSMKLIVEGHTDEVGSDEYNDWLSSARSNAIKSYLCSRGVHPDSVKTYGHGKRRPLIKIDDSPEARACNRRVEFTLTTREWNTVY